MADIKVQSEITGKVWAIEANVGDALEEEDTIIVLESMKMEIPVVAPIRRHLEGNSGPGRRRDHRRSGRRHYGRLAAGHHSGKLKSGITEA